MVENGDFVDFFVRKMDFSFGRFEILKLDIVVSFVVFFLFVLLLVFIVLIRVVNSVVLLFKNILEVMIFFDNLVLMFKVL